MTLDIIYYLYYQASNMIEEAEMIENQKTRDAQDKEKGDDDTI